MGMQYEYGLVEPDAGAVAKIDYQKLTKVFVEKIITLKVFQQIH